MCAIFLISRKIKINLELSYISCRLYFLICLSVCFFAESDIASAAKVQSCGEDLAWRGAGEQHGPWCVEQSGRSAASAGQRRRRDRMLPYCPGAGGQLSHLILHHHSPRPLRHSERSPPTKPLSESHAWTTALKHNTETLLLSWNAFPHPPTSLSVLGRGSAEL